MFNDPQHTPCIKTKYTIEVHLNFHPSEHQKTKLMMEISAVMDKAFGAKTTGAIALVVPSQ